MPHLRFFPQPLLTCSLRTNRVLGWVSSIAGPAQHPSQLPFVPRGTLRYGGLRALSTSSPRRPNGPNLALGVASLGTVALIAAMSSKLIPHNPSEVMVIRHVTPNVVTLSVPFARLGMIPVGGRATIVRLTSGSLAVFSPVALTADVRSKVEEMGGKVQYLIAPDIEHHIFISEWAKEFPSAHIVGPEGLPEKRAKAKDDRIGQERFSTVFTVEQKRAGTQSVTPEFDADFAYEFVDAHANKELVFLYRPDNVLIEADLFFNLPATEQYSKVPEASQPRPGVAARLFCSMQTPSGDAKAMKRFMWYVVSSKDREGFNESCRRIASWDFTTIIPCHGDTIEGNGKDVFNRVFEWHLAGGKAVKQ